MESLPIFQMKENEWTSPKFFDVLGQNIPVHFTPNPKLLFDFIAKFQTRADDVFVVTYPKSGTTWMQEIIWQIYNNGDNSSKHIFERVSFLECLTSSVVSEPVDITKVPSPRLMKSHLSYNTIPKGSSDNTKLYGNRWNDHVLGWWKHKDDPNVLFLKYEDLKKDLLSQVQLTASFLNKLLSEDVISRIAEQCSFSGMTKDLSKYSFNEGKVCLLRKGVVGDWKNYFTPELNERFEREVLSKLEGTGLEFDFEL